MKIFIFLSFLIFSSMVFLACGHTDCETGMENSMGVVNNCVASIDCKTDEDCKEREGWVCSNYNQCIANPCEKLGSECGLGKCIPHDDPATENMERFYCQCDEGAGKIDNVNRCLLKCNSYNDCANFKPDGDSVYPVCSDTVNGGICNLALCHGDNSCPNGMTCNESKNRCE